MEQGKAVDSEGAREILNRITRRREELTRSMTEHIIDEVEEYSESETVDLAFAVEANCRDHFDSLVYYAQTGELSPLTRGSTLSTPVIDHIRQGIRLDAYLHAFRVGQGVFWNAVFAEVTDDPRTALEFVGPSMSYADEISTRIAELYIHTSQRLRSAEE